MSSSPYNSSISTLSARLLVFLLFQAIHGHTWLDIIHHHQEIQQGLLCYWVCNNICMLLVGLYTIYWESSAEEKVCESGRIRECFLELFNLSRNFYVLDCLNRKSFPTNYGKEGNSRNFSSTDDFRYTVFLNV